MMNLIQEVKHQELIQVVASQEFLLTDYHPSSRPIALVACLWENHVEIPDNSVRSQVILIYYKS